MSEPDFDQLARTLAQADEEIWRHLIGRFEIHGATALILGLIMNAARDLDTISPELCDIFLSSARRAVDQAAELTGRKLQ